MSEGLFYWCCVGRIILVVLAPFEMFVMVATLRIFLEVLHSSIDLAVTLI